MVTFFTAVLAVSVAGLVSLLLVKRLEILTGWTLFGRLRPDGFFHSLFVFFERTLPAIIRYFAFVFGRFVQRHFQRVVAWFILHVERKLERVLHIVRSRTAPPTGKGEVSSFLRAVAEHKSKLVNDVPMKRAIFDE